MVFRQIIRNECNSLSEGNNIGAEGARMISEALKNNSTLTKLDLYGDEKDERKLMEQ